eukprot:CAMPEP_0170554764 /NCGR_PEP_ID=MMETSP0211-20121228/12632_1 /TAXON_ID=311385 /ORGANISM="Pseudokeronopsis sp., Strain OXSARD2" /LENGTH=196 /DNA_ID=CAMNT_0010864095 /DNA_START=1798 /DNA_END=2388 /DNA_ORIENTATION=-
MSLSGKNSKEFFSKEGHLKNIPGLNFWPLKKVLMEKYRIKEAEAEAFADFLRPMLEWYPEQRATAQQMLDHPWLKMADNYEYKHSDKEFEVMMLKKDIKEKVKGQVLDSPSKDMGELVDSEEEINAGDLDDSNSDWSCESLMEEDHHKQQLAKRKEKAAKINNSFTGPYPLDPSDFNHTDKGPNFQFEQLMLESLK